MRSERAIYGWESKNHPLLSCLLLFSLSCKKLQPVPQLIFFFCVFWLCSCKAFSVFSLWRKYKEKKQHCVSENTSGCNFGSFSTHTNHIYAFNKILTCLFCFIIRRHKDMCLSREHKPNYIFFY